MGKRIEIVDRLDQPTRAAVDELVEEATSSDGVPPVGEHKYLKLRSGSPSVRALLAYDGERLEGYAQLLLAAPEVTAEVMVRPSARRRGVASRLVAAARDLAAESGAAELKLWAYGDQSASAAIAARRGMVVGRTLLQLERRLEVLPPVPSTDGYTIRSFDVAHDRETWLALHNAVFADHPENGKWSLEDLQARLDQAWFKSEDFLVAESGGRMVGFNWLKQVPAPPPHRAEGEIYIIGVGSSERGRGLGRILALLGLYRLRESGMDVCTLYVEDDNRPALGLYYRLGFTIRPVHRCYAVPVDSALPRKRTFIRSGRAEGP